MKQKVSGSIGKLSDPVKKMDGSESVKKDHDPTRILNILIFPPDGTGLALERPGEAAALLGHNLTQAALCLTFSCKQFQSVPHFFMLLLRFRLFKLRMMRIRTLDVKTVLRN